MSDLSFEVSQYLTPPGAGTWNWSEDGEAIVWFHDDQTIAFRSELEAVLRRHLSKGLPPLGSVLLLIAACRDSWSNVPTLLKTKSTFTVLASEEIRLLDRIHNIPWELRSGISAKVELSAMIFETTSRRTSPEVAEAVVEALANGMAIEAVRREDRLHRRLDDLRPLREGLKRFNLEAFKLRLETGLEQIVAPAEVDEPLATRIRKLFRRLESDEEFAGMVRLARNLLAMVHLPRPLVQPDEIPVGGVSDIANRGSLDRLLLTELAQDDEMLMMRVAMNEAMYLRRETPPQSPPRTRLLLLDAGLRMWGVPRVMATSAAMSFAAMNDGPVDLRVLRSEGERFLPTDSSTCAGLVEHLKALDPHAHPGAALADLSPWMEKEDRETDVILVTSESVLADREFQESMREFGEAIGFIATVSRTGTFQLLERTPHGTRVLREAEFDIEKLFAKTEHPAVPLIDPHVPADLPAILALRPFPLRLSHNFIPQQTWRVQHHGVLSITNDRRLMHWDDPKRGGQQIADRLPSRKLLWSQTRAEQGFASFVVGNNSKPRLWLGVADLEMRRCEFHPLETSDSHVVAVCDHAGFLFVIHRNEIDICDMTTGRRIHSVITPPGVNWIHGRYFAEIFFTGVSRYKALSYDGIEPQFEEVPTGAHRPLMVFDAEGIQGPVGLVTHDGHRVGLSNQEGEVLYLPLVPFHALRELVAPISVVAVSSTGTRVVVKHQWNKNAFQETAVIDVLNRTVMPVYGDPYSALDPEIWKWVHPRNYRNRIRGIARHGQGLLLQTSAHEFLSLSFDDELSRFRMAPIAINRNQVTPLRQFEPIPGPPGVEYKLQMAEWTDGSRAFLDSRGLLHLKSSDPNVPEVSFVLTAGAVSGWCANGELWGDEFYTGQKSSKNLSIDLKNLLSEFGSRLR